jgi:hypothetical protein
VAALKNALRLIPIFAFARVLPLQAQIDYKFVNDELATASQSVNEGHETNWRPKPLPLSGFLSLFVLFAAMTAFLFWQWMPHLHSELIGPPEDNMQDFWNTWYASVAKHPDGFFFTNMIQFPEGTPLYYHSFAYPKVFAIALLSRVTGTELPSLLFLQNISLLISFPLAGVGAFYLVRHFTQNWVGALTGAFVFAFNPSHVAHVMHHAHVSSIEFIPFFVLSYLVAIERKSIIWLGLAIAFYGLSALSCWYYLFYIAYFIAFHTVYTVIRDRAFPRGWSLLTPIACLAGVALVLSPLLVPMVMGAMGGTSVYEPSWGNVADVFGYVVFPPVHLLGSLTSYFYRRFTGNPWESTVYLGLGNLLVMGWLCLYAKQKDSGLLTYVLSGMALFLVFASGNSLHVLGIRTIPMPDALLSKLPFFANVRTPSRAIVFAYLFLAVGIGHATSLVWQHRHRLPIRWGLPAMAGLMVLDFYPFHLLMTPVSCPPGLTLIRNDPERDFGILNLPSDLPVGRTPRSYMAGNSYMLQQTCHGRPIVKGQISRHVAVTLQDRLETQNLDAQRHQLAAAKIKYIVISPLFQWSPKEDGQQDDYSRTYPIVYSGPDLTILRVY